MHEKFGGEADSPLELRVWLRLLSCCTMIEKKLRRNFISEFATTLPRFDVMSALMRSPDGLTMGELSRCLLVSAGNVTSIIHYLINAGHVLSNPHPLDKRTAIVALSPDGMRFFKELAQAHRQWIEEAMQDFDVESQETLYILLAQLKSAITRGQE